MRDAEASNLRFAMLALAAAMLSSAAGAQPQGWSVYGGDAAGTRYSTATEITKANVAELRIAWTYHTGDAARHGASFVRSVLAATAGDGPPPRTCRLPLEARPPLCRSAPSSLYATRAPARY